MSPLKIALMVVALGLTACEEAKAPATIPDSLAGTLDADAADNAGTAEAVTLPACIPPANPGTLPAGQIAPGCYKVCKAPLSDKHHGEEGVQVQRGNHLQLKDGVEIGKVGPLTTVNIRPNNEGAGPSSMRPDEQWPMLGNAQKTKVEGARIFTHAVDGATVAVPHKIEISKATALPVGCRNNVIRIKFCSNMVVTQGGTTTTQFLCQDPGIVGPDQGHVHAEN